MQFVPLEAETCFRGAGADAGIGHGRAGKPNRDPVRRRSGRGSFPEKGIYNHIEMVYNLSR